MSQQSWERASEGTIIAAVLVGDTERFSLLVDRYRRELVRAAHSRLGRAEWAEDAVQETFLCALKSLRTYDSRYSFRTWLWTILVNQCRRHQKRQALRSHVPLPEQGGGEPLALAEDGEPDSPTGRLLVEERDRRLHELLDRLPPAQADALRLRFFSGLKYREIAETMGSSLSCAKVRVREGLQRMSRLLRHEEEASVL